MNIAHVVCSDIWFDPMEMFLLTKLVIHVYIGVTIVAIFFAAI